MQPGSPGNRRSSFEAAARRGVLAAGRGGTARQGHDPVAIKERDEWRSLSDPDVIALARVEQRAIVTANLRDFRPLHAELVTPGGEGHAGMVFVPTSFRLTRAATGQLVDALGVRLAEYHGDHDLVNGETWI